MLRLSRRLLAVACFAPALSSAQAADFSITPKAASRIQFVSKAPMETFGGETREVSGSVALDPESLGDSITVSVSVDLRTLDTGIELRNKHMRENHLHTDEFPTATFRGGRLSQPSAPTLTEGKTVTATVQGELELHGKKQPLAAPVELTLQKGTLHVVTKFKVKLADFGIPRPQFLVMKLDEVQSVTADLEARPK